MCRLAAYLGPPAPLSALLYDPPHSLEVQAYAPKQMVTGHVNVDGTGVAWWPEGEGEPVRYVTTQPPWADANLPHLARRLRGGVQLAAVRSATPGVPHGPGNVAPFVYGGLAGVHNGSLGRFREQTGRALASRLPDDLHAAVDAVSDSLLVFLTIVKHLRADPAAGVAGALRAGVAEVVEVCEAERAPATLNVVVADATRVVGVRTARGVPANNPLYVARAPAAWPGASLIASEPLDGDAAWEAVPDDSIVEIGPDGVRVTSLDEVVPG